jgi:hypothetical protein
MRVRIAAFALALAVLAPGAARAGPDMSIPFDAFPITRHFWRQHALSELRDVSLSAPSPERQLLWTAEFQMHDPSLAREVEGVLDLSGAPTDCASSRIALPTYDWQFSQLRFRDHLVYLTQKQRSRTHVPPEVDVKELMEHFADTLPDPTLAVYPDGSSCRRIRMQCASDTDGGYPASYSGSSFTEISARECADVERVVERCLAGARTAREQAVRARDDERRCNAIAIPSRPDAKSLQLVVLGGDGTEWGRSELRYEGLAIGGRFWMVAPFTVLADVPVMALNAVVLVILYGIAVPLSLFTGC